MSITPTLREAAQFALPAIPPMKASLDTGGGWMAVPNGYTADQMRDYAFAAIEALSAALAVPDKSVACIKSGSARGLFMVIDCESIGLHGEAFSVAWVVVNGDGERLDEGCLACDPGMCSGTDESRRWVSDNVPPLEVTSPTKQHLRNMFWHEWRRWADRGAVLVADCAWPVEANFLSACVRLNHKEREWQGPYPLHELASVLLALGTDPTALTERLPDELPAHHPLMDARQSARQLLFSLSLHPAPERSEPACTPPATAEPDKLLRQYFHRVNDCRAKTSKDADCICWHDEGKGPVPDAKHTWRHKSWRNKPPAAHGIQGATS